MSGVLGNQLAQLSRDKDYIAARDRQTAYGQPKTAMQGIGQGLKSLGDGLVQGATGLVTAPIKEAQKDDSK